MTGISRASLAPYFGQTLTLSGTLDANQRGRLSLLVNLNHPEGDYITDHLWLMLPSHRFPAGMRLRIKGIVSKYTHERTMEEAYGLKKVEIIGWRDKEHQWHRV